MKLYVGNLAFSVTDADLREVFSPFGNVVDSFILMDRATNRSRGFGFVTMSNQAEGEAAIEGLNGQEVGGRRLTINEARPMEERKPRTGGGGGGGGGRDRFSDRR
ncbi:MAG: RNA-binding protein, partial [Verrucomicrobia bacterium RIFCSPHIGHO2_12_FULL_41_10]